MPKDPGSGLLRSRSIVGAVSPRERPASSAAAPSEAPLPTPLETPVEAATTATDAKGGGSAVRKSSKQTATARMMGKVSRAGWNELRLHGGRRSLILL